MNTFADGSLAVQHSLAKLFTFRWQFTNSKTGYSETFPIRGLRVNEKDEVEVFVGNFGTIYTDKFLRGNASEERWRPLKGSDILFYQTILSIAKTIDEYIPA